MKVKCSRCDALCLRSTFDKTDGFCMPCFMALNNCLKPAELCSLKERGLFEYFNSWNEFIKRGTPKIRSNRGIVDKLNHYLPVINASISGYLRFGEGSFDGEINIQMLSELRKDSKGELLEFLIEIEKFNNELINVSKK